MTAGDEGGRIFFTSTGRSLVDEDEIVAAEERGEHIYADAEEEEDEEDWK